MSSGKATAAAPGYDEGEQSPLSLDLAGNVRVIASGGGPGGATVVVGTDTPADAKANPSDAVRVTSFAEAFNGATWDRVRVVAAGDAVANPSIALASASFLQAFDGAAWRRLRANGGGSLRTLATPPVIGDTDTATSSPLAAGTAGMVGVISAARSKLLSLDARCAITLGGWFQLHNKTTAPASTEVPVMAFHIAVNSEGVISLGNDFFNETGRLFTTGISWGFSSTAATFTVAADSPYSVNASYIT